MILIAVLNSNSKLLEMETFTAAPERFGQSQSLMENIFERNTQNSHSTPLTDVTVAMLRN